MKLNLQKYITNQRNVIFSKCFSPINLSLNDLRTQTHTSYRDLKDIVMTEYNDPVNLSLIH